MSTPYESEVVIQFDKGSNIATVYTSDPDKAKALMKYDLEPIATTTRDGEVTSWTFEIPKQTIRIKLSRGQLVKIGGSGRLPSSQEIVNEGCAI